MPVLLIAALIVLIPAADALAHTSERGFILLLPTQYYLAGGTAAVAASFLIMTLVRPEAVCRAAAARLRFGWIGRGGLDEVLSGLSFLGFAALIYLGVEGPRDPLTNPLPLAIWTLGWIGLTLAHAIFGNLWAVLNPWRFPVRLIRKAAGAAPEGVGPFALPDWMRVWPACAIFMAIAWFELVDLAPDDPDRLAIAVSFYWLIGFVGCLAFGEKIWLAAGEPLAILFKWLALIAPIQVRDDAAPNSRRLELCWPGAAILEAEAPNWRIAVFLLLTLATVSFDGGLASFWWLDLNGINPLEFPGRSAVQVCNTVGLFGAWILFVALYWLCIGLGERMVGGPSVKQAAGLFILSIVPITLAYHFSHYLTVFLVNGQWSLVAFNDPMGTGADLLGLKDFRVTTSFLNVAESIQRIWQIQVAAIVIGHLLAVVLAHGLMARRQNSSILSAVPLGILMVFYTLFGLWLLSTPTAG